MIVEVLHPVLTLPQCRHPGIGRLDLVLGQALEVEVADLGVLLVVAGFLKITDVAECLLMLIGLLGGGLLELLKSVVLIVVQEALGRMIICSQEVDPEGSLT